MCIIFIVATKPKLSFAIIFTASPLKSLDAIVQHNKWHRAILWAARTQELGAPSLQGLQDNIIW